MHDEAGRRHALPLVIFTIFSGDELRIDRHAANLNSYATRSCIGPVDGSGLFMPFTPTKVCLLVLPPSAALWLRWSELWPKTRRPASTSVVLQQPLISGQRLDHRNSGLFCQVSRSSTLCDFFGRSLTSALVGTQGEICMLSTQQTPAGNSVQKRRLQNDDFFND